MEEIKILWADDEIDLLKPHIMFLEEKGYSVKPVNNGDEAVEACQSEYFDLIFLDENMPGLSGLETLVQIKDIRPQTPVIMITKSEEEYLMEDAIGSQISDYLIKPVNPKQVLLSIKKQLDNKRLVSEKITVNYQQDFRNLAMRVNETLDHKEWRDVYKKLIYWELELEKSDDESMKEVLSNQKTEANANFSNFVEDNYQHWLQHPDDAPLMSHKLFYNKVVPLLDDDKPVFMVVIDNLRLDQWKVLQPYFSELFRIKEDESYYSILPTATNYSRNALLAGMLPSQIEKNFPGKWLNDEEEGGKNLHEEDFIKAYLKRLNKDVKLGYTKITNLNAGKVMLDNVHNFFSNDLTIVIYNFIDFLSHMRTEMEVIKELAEDESAYRSLTRSWFEHSPLYEMLQEIAEKDVHLVLTTDHGTIRVKKPSKIIGDRNTTTNLRYKHGRNLNYNKKDVLSFRNPDDAFLPKPHVNSSFVFAKEDSYFVYPNNYNYYVNFFKNTFQHGGISLEEMIIPIITMDTK